MLILRLLMTLGLLGVGFGAYQFWMRRQLAQVASQVTIDPLLKYVDVNTATIVYFTTPHCIPCQTQQRPALARLQDEMGDSVQVIQVDATQDPDAAQRWGVMTAPMTFILSPQGTPQNVNYGVVNEHVLKQQIQQAVGVA